MTENTRIWDALKVTDPKYTKKVEFGRKFTSINSQWQLQRMTEQFGPIGKGWGYTVQHSVERITPEYVLAIADVSIWWMESRADANTRVVETSSFGPVRGMSPILEKNRYDDDAGKKAMTDALTKGLSHLGLSADVFLGLFDDNKYVSQVREQFKEGRPQEMTPPSGEQPSVPDEDRHLLTKEHGETSTYQVNKRKAAEKFLGEALAVFATIAGNRDVDAWYDTAVSPGGRSTHRDAVARLGENFPDLADKLAVAADNARNRDAYFLV